MKIHPFAYVCPRDWDLFEMLVWSVERLRDTRVEPFIAWHDPKEHLTPKQAAYCADHAIRVRERPAGFFPWDGWVSCMSKLEGWKRTQELASWRDTSPTTRGEFIMYVDCDAVFHSREVFDRVEATADDCGFFGFPHSEKRKIGRFGRDWSWMSGSLQICGAEIVDSLHRVSDEWLMGINEDILLNGLSRNEDVVMSYIFTALGAMEYPLDGLHENEPEAALAGRPNAKPFTHLNGGWPQFLGVPVGGKWGIPKALRAKGIMP